MSIESRQIAAVRASDAFYVGGNWGIFVDNEEDYQKFYDILTADRDVRVLKAQNGVIAFADTKFLYDSLCQVTSVPQEVVALHKSRVGLEVAELKKIMNSVYSGTSKYAKMQNGNIDINIGLYSCNKGHKIFVNGIEYCAVSLSLEEALKVLKEYTAYSNVFVYTGNGYKEIRELDFSRDEALIASGLTLANSSTGAFLTLRLCR